MLLHKILRFVVLLSIFSPYFSQDADETCSAVDGTCSPEAKLPASCEDNHESCPGWAKVGECDSNQNFMLNNCMLSCGKCPDKQICSEDDGNCTADEKQAVLCEDNHESCPGWAKVGECDSNPTFMLNNCKLSCGKCPGKIPSSCKDDNDQCEKWADGLECESNPNYMLKNCRLSCGVCHDDNLVVDLGVEQKAASLAFPDIDPADVLKRIESSEEYMKTTHMRRSLREACNNKHELCTIWAISGRCETKPDYMHIDCAPACHSCEAHTIEGRCPVDPNAPIAWKEGELNKMFEKLTQEPYLTEYGVQTLSSPATNGPWVITMENVVGADEAERLIELGLEEGYARSTDVGKMKADGTTEKSVSTGRTSSNAWCQHACYDDSYSQAVVHRLTNLTGIDERNSEYLQLLRYEPGQYYHSHHDYIPFNLKRQQGVRILTMYLYLNDVEEGGGTNFDKLNVTVMPKRGRALVWPSVLNDHPNMKDDRTTHQALPVEKGIKFGANAWFHMRDFKTPHAEGCT